MCTAFWPL